MRKLLGMLAGALIATAVLSMPSAKADTFTYTGFSVVGGGVGVSVTGPVVANVLAGQTILHGSGANAGTDLAVWCVDLLNVLQNGPYTYQISTLTTAGVGQGNPTLTTQQITAIADLIAHAGGSDVQHEAAVQLAIWKEIYGAAFTTAGVDPTIASLESFDLANVLPGGLFFDTGLTVEFLHDAPIAPDQAMAFVVPATPLPAAVWMFGTGLAGLGGLALRRRRKA